MRRFLNLVVILGVAWSLFQLATAALGFYPALMQRALHVSFAVALGFLAYPLRREKKTREHDGSVSEGDRTEEHLRRPRRPTWIDVALAAVALGCGVYIAVNYERLVQRIPFVSPLPTLDVVVGATLLVLLLEASRRVIGWTLPILALIFLTYQVVGPYLPGLLAHTGTDVKNLIELQALGVQGIFGVPTGVVGNFVFYFVLFAAFMKVSGAGELFNDLALRLTGRLRGGPAKSSVVGSSLMGMLSGSAVGNVATTGVFTIPLMKRTGYSSRFAGAVEAAASTGGQLVPPIMGAAAFIMAEFLRRPYYEVALAAIIPSLAYFVALFFVVDFHSRRHDLGMVPQEEMPRGKDIAVRLHLLAPLVVLVALIFMQFSLQLAALYGIVATVIVAWFRRKTWLTPGKMVDALASGARQALAVTIPAATAGIIVGVVSYSGLGLRFSSLVLQAGGGLLLPTLVLVAIASIIIGTGMPTTGAYITAAVLVAPALVELGVPGIAAHLFVLYFAVLSMVTPPVALSSFAAAAISGAGSMQTGFTSLRLALAGFVVPFAFVLQPALVGERGVAAAIPGAIGLLLSVVCLAAVVTGYLLKPISRVEGIVLVAAGLLLVVPGVYTGLAGAAILIAMVLLQWRGRWPATQGGGDGRLDHIGITE